jgi:outer membrane beta-barrel protein
MARRLNVLLLIAAAAGAAITPAALAQSQTDATAAAKPEVVVPEVERRTVKRAPVLQQNFEVGVFVGSINIEDFGTSAVYGGRIAYHLTEDFFFEAFYGDARAGRTSYEELAHEPVMTPNQRDYRYYDFGVGWNALPGEVFIGRGRAMPSALYLSLGFGGTSFADDDMFTTTFGVGYRLLVSDWLAVHIDARDQIFDADYFGHNQRDQNLQLTVGLTAFF